MFSSYLWGSYLSSGGAHQLDRIKADRAGPQLVDCLEHRLSLPIFFFFKLSISNAGEKNLISLLHSALLKSRE